MRPDSPSGLDFRIPRSVSPYGAMRFAISSSFGMASSIIGFESVGCFVNARVYMWESDFCFFARDSLIKLSKAGLRTSFSACLRYFLRSYSCKQARIFLMLAQSYLRRWRRLKSLRARSRTRSSVIQSSLSARSVIWLNLFCSCFELKLIGSPCLKVGLGAFSQ